MGKDYYNILGVDKTATKDDIKKTYRKLAMEYHPDKNPGDKVKEERFKDISEAYSVLIDDEKRSKYDRFGNVNGQDFNMNDFMGGINFDDIFGGFGFDFGNPFGNRWEENTRVKKGNNLRIKLNISLIDVRDGFNKTFKYKRKIKCDKCDGFGGTHDTCSTCGGSGRIMKTKRTMFGSINTQGDCPVCKGDGFIITNQCDKCFGTGVIDDSKELNINIPKGVENGDKFKLSGNGDSPYRPGNGGIYGDLILEVNVDEDPNFIRNGINLIYKLNTPIPILILGGKIKIPTLDSMVEVNLKSHTKVGEVFRLRGKGLSDQRGYKGDILVEVSVDTPKNITKEEKELLKKLSEMPNFKKE